MRIKKLVLVSVALAMVLLWAGGEKAARGAEVAPAADVELFLSANAALEKHVVWVTGDGKRLEFSQWSPEQKKRIDVFYKDFMRRVPRIAMRLPTEDKIDGNSGNAFFTSDVAFDVYAAHVAHVMYVESKRLVPWSILERPGTELDELLASSSYFARIGKAKETNTYPAGIEPNRDFQETPENVGLGEWNGDPRVGYDFLSGKTSAKHKNLIGQTELETLVNLTLWMRDNLDHGPMDAKEKDRAKTVRWLEDRLRAGRGMHTALANQGCHSAAKLLVDLARSVNIPLLHARALDNLLGDQGGSLFSHSHGALVYGWGGKEPRVLWHSDEIYARDGRVCFPLDPKTGELAAPEMAAQMYFDELWVSPRALARAGFVYKLERVIPGKGFGKETRGGYEDRLDYGMVCGYWKKNNKSMLDDLFQWSHDYALCGRPLLHLAANKVVEAQLEVDMTADRGGFTEKELGMRPLKEYGQRAEAGLKAVGGAARFEKLAAEMEKSRGGNLMAEK